MTDSFERREWDLDVEAKTRHFRVQRAGRHARLAQQAARDGDGRRATWHAGRAKGQLRRFDQVRDCGGAELLVCCEECGHEVKRLEAKCGHYRICVSCRGARAARERYRFREAREWALRRADTLLRHGGRGGRWSEKFLTLTLPHSGDAERDVKALPPAWRQLRKRLFEYFRLDLRLPESEVERVAFVRVLEVTAGRRNDGHAHLHLYLLCPFLPVEWLAHSWGQVLTKLDYQVPSEPLHDLLCGVDERRRGQLERLLVTRRGAQGRPLSDVYCPVVFIERCEEGIEAELIKYLVKDLERAEDGSEKLMPPELFAKVYAALEGVRTVQASTGFWRKRTRQCRCEKCGSDQTTRERVRKPDKTARKPGAE